VARAQLLEQRLRGVRNELRIQDFSALGDPHHDTGIELWVHPDDEARAGGIVNGLLADL